MKDIRQKLLATFQVEHRDHVEQIRSLLAMIGTTSEPLPGPELEEVFRRAHSLKGAARAVDLRSVEGLAHRLETLFSRVRQGALPLNHEVTAAVQQALDASEDCVTALGENRPPPDFEPALQAIDQVLGMESVAAAAPPAERKEPEKPAPVPTFQPLETVRITAQNFDGLLRSAGGLLTESQRQGQITAQLNAISRHMSVLLKEAEATRRAASVAAPRYPGARRDLARIIVSSNSIERQARSLAKQSGSVRRLQQHSSWTLGRLGRQLQRDVWQARMVPAESLFEGCRKMMRDLARDEAKQIEFRASSTGVQADRGVLETLKDPLMHALRNAVSHGIETPQERTAKGKSPVGSVSLRIESEGQRLTIAVEDDGRGIDLARVAEVAARQGIIPESEVARHSSQELARILFRPGFSTSRSVSDLSGRGMGLSVVYEAVRLLQGDVDLQPGKGCGTTLHLSVPLSISTHRLLLISCGGRPFAIPMHWIERLHRIRLDRVETMEGKPVVNLDGRQLRLLSLRHVLGLEQQAPSGNSDELWLMVIRSKTRRAAVAVDVFLREMEAVIQDLGPVVRRGGKISGGILLEDGAIAFVLNPLELLETSGYLEAADLLKPPVKIQQDEAEASSILVVDDSMTTRTLEKSILEAHGYRVRVAVDGMEALAQLRTEKADLVIADVQMPRMDGFELLEAMKKTPALSGIPVIIVTSLEQREDQERGLALGADAYIVKRKFDQGELLAAIHQIL